MAMLIGCPSASTVLEMTEEPKTVRTCLIHTITPSATHSCCNYTEICNNNKYANSVIRDFSAIKAI